MGPRAIVKLFRTNEQTEAIEERKPTLTDPFTIEIDKFNTNKIPEDGECFEVVLDLQQPLCCCKSGTLAKGNAGTSVAEI